MRLSSYLPRQAENDLSKLIQSQEIQYNEGLIGCCKKYFLIFPNDHHKYLYNGDKLISDKLKKKVFNYLYKTTPYTNMSKRLNKKTTIIDDLIAPDDDDDKFGLNKNLSKGARALRTKNKVKTIQKAARAKIERTEHTIQIIYDITTEEAEGVLTTQEYDSKVFTVFGGKQKIRKAIETTSKYIYDYLKESYDWELIDFKIKRIFIDEIKTNITDFEDIKMFGTLLNLCGYDLNVVNTEIKDACCVEYHVKMFNSYRNHGWTNERFMDETGMASISEGVTLNQMIPIYIKYRIGYHIVDFKYHKTASHNDHNYTPTKHYPSLFYMIENNHLYQITNKHDTKSISQLETGKPHKTFKHKEVKPVKRTVHKFHRPIEILAMIGQARFDECSQIFDMELCKNDIFVCETPHVIHDLFYTLLKKTCYIIKTSASTTHELHNLILETLQFKKTQIIKMLRPP